MLQAQENLQAAGSGVEIKEVVADKGYHAAQTLELAGDLQLRTYIPEPRLPHDGVWTDKPPEFQPVVYANRQRVRRAKGRRLRSEYGERTFAHICDTGGMRRSWLRGLENVTKRDLLAAAAHRGHACPRTCP